MKNKGVKVIVAIIVILLIVILVFLLFRPEALQKLGSLFGKLWLWLVGLAGGLVLGFKKLVGSISGKGSSLNEISESNDVLKKRLEDIEAKIDQTNKRYDLEKELYKKDIELLEFKLAAKEKELTYLSEKQKTLEGMSDDDYWNSLSEDQKARIQKNIDDHTVHMSN